MRTVAGIDYGSKLAGTTAIAYVMADRVIFEQSAKKQDADLFLQQVVVDQSLDTLFIDAPLSLPKAYFGEGEDFFYRACDRELKAMSPMFLGGLTARAMKLQSIWQSQGIQCYETYPGHTAKTLQLLELGYKKEKENIPHVLSRLQEELSKDLPALDNWHGVDAVLALGAALRFTRNQHEVIGDAQEGCIYV